MITDLTLASRYLGFGANEPDPKTMAELKETAAQLEQLTQGKWVFGSYDLLRTETEIRLVHTDIVLKGKNIRGILKDSSSVYIMACTLGSEADRLIARQKVLSPTSALIADACASAFIESIADACQKEIEEKLPEGATLTFRYAPGYGDLPLDANREILKELKAEKRIGIHLSDTTLMIPRKSIVAILGIREAVKSEAMQGACGKPESKDQTEIKGCARCNLQNGCAFRSTKGE